jgi:hypothetical protein
MLVVLTAGMRQRGRSACRVLGGQASSRPVISSALRWKAPADGRHQLDFDIDIKISPRTVHQQAVRHGHTRSSPVHIQHPPPWRPTLASGAGRGHGRGELLPEPLHGLGDQQMNADLQPLKVCYACGDAKPLDEFRPRKNGVGRNLCCCQERRLRRHSGALKGNSPGGQGQRLALRRNGVSRGRNHPAASSARSRGRLPAEEGLAANRRRWSRRAHRARAGWG